MWTCQRCGEEIEEGFDVCWNCGTDIEGTPDPEFEVADAPVEEPIVVGAWDLNGLRSSPLTISSLNYGLGRIVGCLLGVSFAVLFLGVLAFLHVEQGFKLTYAIVFGVFLLVNLVQLFRVVADTVLGIELSDRIVARRLFGSVEYATTEVVSVEFEDELKAGFTSLFLGFRRFVTFVLKDGTRLRVHIDAPIEARLRQLTSTERDV